MFVKAYFVWGEALYRLVVTTLPRKLQNMSSTRLSRRYFRTASSAVPKPNVKTRHGVGQGSNSPGSCRVPPLLSCLSDDRRVELWEVPCAGTRTRASIRQVSAGRSAARSSLASHGSLGSAWIVTRLVPCRPVVNIPEGCRLLASVRKSVLHDSLSPLTITVRILLVAHGAGRDVHGPDNRREGLSRWERRGIEGVKEPFRCWSVGPAGAKAQAPYPRKPTRNPQLPAPSQAGQVFISEQLPARSA